MDEQVKTHWSASRGYMPIFWLTEKEIKDIQTDDRLQLKWVDEQQKDFFLHKNGSKDELLQLTYELKCRNLDPTILCRLNSVSTSILDWTEHSTRQILNYRAATDRWQGKWYIGPGSPKYVYNL